MKRWYELNALNFREDSRILRAINHMVGAAKAHRQRIAVIGGVVRLITKQ